ncbi:MAG: M20/M25/M40 family metallo-hydrolase [Caldilineaceae bacterium]|nr:M20/M25/M40 family metallo-hydrolase [Caldilineaceae bacterium]
MQIPTQAQVDLILSQIDRQRIIDTAVALVEIPSPTRSAGAAATKLAEILTNDGFVVERPVADWPEAPAVVVRLESGRPGRTLQFDGHLDTVHLPFVPPRVEDGVLYGSGASDMKGGIAAFVEALRVLRDTDSLPGGSVLLTAHDHHEGPWGDRRQVQALMRAGIVGDAVLLPEYLADPLPVAGRGMAIFEIKISREGAPVHEVLRPAGLPDVVAAGAQLVTRLHELHDRIKQNTQPYIGHDSLFVGRIQAGEIYNQSPTECSISGTRRWITPGAVDAVRAQLDALLADVAAATNTTIEIEFTVQGDAYQLDQNDPFVHAFQHAHAAVTGAGLPFGPKPFIDDGTAYATGAGIPAISHGPAATGAHTLHEAAPIAELVRVAQVYALTAIGYCGEWGRR